MRDIKIIKKNGNLEKFDPDRIRKAVTTSAERVMVDLTDEAVDKIIDIVRITPVPRSGCNIMSPKNNPTTINTGNISLKFIFFTFDKYLEIKIINPNLANSLGCILKEKILNQLCDPFLTTPIPGIKTITKSAKHVNIIILAFL